jgi:hypothetical protein
LAPINGDIPKFGEVARRFPDTTLRRRLIGAYFTTANRKVKSNPYTVGWFLHFADMLAEQLDADAFDEVKRQEFLKS